MRPSLSLLSSALFCAATTLAAHADTVNISITGADGTFSFSLLSTANPVADNPYFDVFALSSATYDGHTIADNTITLYTPADSGGLYLTDASGSAYLSEFGPQIFSGRPASPIFTGETVTLGNGSSLVDGITRTGTGDLLTVSVVPTTSAVPEPASLALLGSGATGLLALLRRRTSSPTA